MLSLSSGRSTGRTDTARSREQISDGKRCVVYIAAQEAHHRKLTFQAEFLALLKAHEIEYDERYLWK